VSSGEHIFPKFTTAGQMAVFWRMIHLTTVVWGNHPSGQLLVALTMAFLHNRGMNPTVSDLCKATGLPKATVSRYVSWQLSQNLAKEVIDPHDRRRRTLHRTEQGQKSWDWQVKKVSDMFSQITEESGRYRSSASKFDPSDLLTVMKRITKEDEAEELP
jgi:DNA-binding MarR family transcriptional regulator